MSIDENSTFCRFWWGKSRNALGKGGALGAAMVLGIAGLAGCSTAETSSQSASDTAENAVTVGLTYIPSVQFAPVYVAEDDGIFDAAGIDATIRHHGSDEALFTALAAGEEDVTIASADELLQARAAGMDLVSVGAFYHEYPTSILVKADSGIETLEDLAGHSIGYPGDESGSSWFGLQAALQEAGLTSNDMDLQPIGYTQSAALASGQVDAVVGFVNSDAIQLEQLGVETVNLCEDTDFPLIAASIVTTAQFAEDKPELLTDVVTAINDGVQAVIDDADHALEVSARYDETLSDQETRDTAEAILLATISLWKASDGQANATQDLELWQEMSEFLAALLGLSLEETELEQAVTNDYVA